jgi:hypothetical protein
MTRTKTRQIYSNHIKVVEQGNAYAISLGEELLNTPAKHLVTSSDGQLLLHMVSELEQHPFLWIRDGVITKPRSLCAYLIYSTQKDFIEEGKGLSAEMIADSLEADPFYFPSNGPEAADQIRSWVPLLMSFFGGEYRPRADYSEVEWGELCATIASLWNDLDAAQKAVIVNLTALSDGHFTAALALSTEKITDVEFANAVVAGSPLHWVFGPAKHHQPATREACDWARICLSYLQIVNSEASALGRLIAAGEGSRREFKSTLRWDLKENRKNPAITHAVLKTIAAFANTNGGTLMIGVADDGTPIGIEKDQLDNDDKWMLHLMNVVKASLGPDVAALLEVDVVPLRGVKVARVTCRPSPSPVYLSAGISQVEEFYIRTGPGSTLLGPRELVMYVHDHFSGQGSQGVG